MGLATGLAKFDLTAIVGQGGEVTPDSTAVSPGEALQHFARADRAYGVRVEWDTPPGTIRSGAIAD